jgi:hypothetical protein
LDSPNDRQLAAELEKTSEYKQKAAEIERLRAANPILSGFVKKYVDFYNDTKLGYVFWNGKEYETFATEAFRLSMQIYGDSPMNLHYQTRNQHMVDLVLAALKDKPVRRAIVLAGVLHKHYLDRAFRQNPNLSVAGFSALLPLKPAKLSKGVRALLEEDNDLPYFERGYPRELDQHFDEKLARLAHGRKLAAGTAQEEQMLRLIYEDKPYQRLTACESGR